MRNVVNTPSGSDRGPTSFSDYLGYPLSGKPGIDPTLWIGEGRAFLEPVSPTQAPCASLRCMRMDYTPRGSQGHIERLRLMTHMS